jgi:hypothetical protein
MSWDDWFVATLMGASALSLLLLVAAQLWR